MRSRRQRMFLTCATVLATAAGGALVAIPAGAARTPHPTAHAVAVPAAVTDNLRELNNKLARAITRLKAELRKKGSVVKDTERERRTLNDLEATKLRAVDAFPEVFGLPYAETFQNLDCIDQEIAIGKIALDELERGYLRGPIPAGTRYASSLLLRGLEQAKDCKDILETQLARGTATPSTVTDNLRELNNKLARAITRLKAELRKKGSVVKDIERERRTLNDLEATKLRAVDAFPEVFGLPYAETFQNLDCIDQEIAIGKIALDELERGYLRGPIPAGTRYASSLLLRGLEQAKDCKDALEVLLSAPSTVPCSGHAMLGNIYGGQAHELVTDFACSKASTGFSLTLPSGYQFTSGQASNTSEANAYTCSDNTSNTTVSCTGTVPPNSTSYVQAGTSPDPQSGMKLRFKVSFSDSSTTSFTVESK